MERGDGSTVDAETCAVRVVNSGVDSVDEG